MAAKPRLLIVDDEISVARTMAMIFEGDGYAVEVTFSAKEALQCLVRQPRFDIVVTDLSMESSESGFEVVRAARKLRSKPIIIISTGNARESNLQTAWRLKVDHVVLKPTPVDEIRNAVRRLLSLRNGAH